MATLVSRFGLSRLGRKLVSCVPKGQPAATFLAAVCVVATVPAVSGADLDSTPQPDSVATNDSSQAEALLPFDAQRLGMIKGTFELFGQKATDPQRKTVGKIRDLILDNAAGRLAAVVVDSGGKLPMTVVPVGTFVETLDGKAQVDSPKEVFQNAPHFAKTRFASEVSAADLANSFRYFHQAVPETPAAADAGFRAATSLRNQPVLSQSGEALGRLQDLIVDLSAGRVVYLVIKPNDGLDLSGDLYPVPPGSVKADAAGRTLALKADAAYFLAGHHYSKDFPTAMNLPQVAVAVYGHYGLLLPAPKRAAAASPGQAAL
jgi:sporulation protein YlmC with PRC-barrel domain